MSEYDILLTYAERIKSLEGQRNALHRDLWKFRQIKKQSPDPQKIKTYIQQTLINRRNGGEE